MKVSRAWIEWAHGPGAESDQPLAIKLCGLAAEPGRGSVEIDDPRLIAEVVDVAECYQKPSRGDALYDMGPWWMGYPRQDVAEGKAELALARS